MTYTNNEVISNIKHNTNALLVEKKNNCKSHQILDTHYANNTVTWVTSLFIIKIDFPLIIPCRRSQLVINPPAHIILCIIY
jgi:hypothetical protein